MLMIFFLILNHRHSHTCTHVHTNILLHSYLTTSLSGRRSWRYSNARRINKKKPKTNDIFTCRHTDFWSTITNEDFYTYMHFLFLYFSLKRNITSDREAIRGKDSVLGLHKRTHDPRLQDSWWPRTNFILSKDQPSYSGDTKYS